MSHEKGRRLTWQTSHRNFLQQSALRIRRKKAKLNVWLLPQLTMSKYIMNYVHIIEYICYIPIFLPLKIHHPLSISPLVEARQDIEARLIDGAIGQPARLAFALEGLHTGSVNAPGFRASRSFPRTTRERYIYSKHSKNQNLHSKYYQAASSMQHLELKVEQFENVWETVWTWPNRTSDICWIEMGFCQVVERPKALHSLAKWSANWV